MNHSALLKQMDPSYVNFFAAESTLTSTHPISMDHNRRVINEIIDDMFDERKGTCDVSSSQCSSLRLRSSEYSYDKRLKYWKDVLKDRQRLEQKITKKTSKKPADILYNRLSTIDERDKQTVRRIMDYAERMNPVQLSLKSHSVLPEKQNHDTCTSLAELQETLPRAERDARTTVEISGLPKAIRLEMLGKPKHQGQEKRHTWLRSKVLESRVEEKREDIERVIEYYPDIENLQVIGESLFKTEVPEHNSEIQLLKPEHICEISSESQENEKRCVNEPRVEMQQDFVEYGLKINDQLFIITSKRSSKNIAIESQFTCEPFGREVKKLMVIHNVGQKVLNFDWSRRSYYAKNSALLKASDNEFVFDHQSFRLCRGQAKEIFVVYQPRKVELVKSKWVLKVNPCCFCRKTDGIVMRLIGNCVPPPEYINRLNEIQTNVIEKSNLKMMRNLTTGLGAITPQITPPEVICPYKRSLNEVELFEQLNRGYKCERYHDLELLKDLYRRVKKPREKLWDFKVDSLRCAVLRVDNADARAFYFNELTNILADMKGKCVQLEMRILASHERDKTRFLYVKGILSSNIDEWEELTTALEEAFVRTSLPMVKEELQAIQLNTEVGEDEGEMKNALLDDELALHTFVLEKRVRCLKPFRDSLYMQTYTMVCNFVENIVNIIEGTEMI